MHHTLSFIRYARNKALKHTTSRPRAARDLLVSIMLSYVGLTGCTKPHRIYPHFPAGDTRIRTVAIIPLDARLRLQEVGTILEAPLEDQAAFRLALQESARLTLLDCGVHAVIPECVETSAEKTGTSAIPRSTIADGELEREKALGDISYTDAVGFLRTRARNPIVESILSERIPELSARLHVDAILFIHFEAIELSLADYSIELTRSFLISIAAKLLGSEFAQRNSLYGDILLVEGNTGRVLFYTSVDGASTDPKDPEEIGELMTELFAPLKRKVLSNNS